MCLDRQVIDSLPFKFGIDENGNYGYYKDGADSVTPFKQSAKAYKVGTITQPDAPNAADSKTFNCSQIPGYKNFKSSDFVVRNVRVGAYSSTYGGSAYSSTMNLSYNSDNGVLTVSNLTGTVSATAKASIYYADIYVIPGLEY